MYTAAISDSFTTGFWARALATIEGNGIKSMADLKGKRVALDEPGSGTLINARLVLAAYGIKETDIKRGLQPECIGTAKPGYHEAPSPARRLGVVISQGR